MSWPGEASTRTRMISVDDRKPTRSAGIDRVRVCIVLLMFGFSVMSYFNRTIMSIAGPVIMKEFSLTETEMGSVYSAFLWSYALLMIPGGALADRFGPRIVLTTMAIGSAVFTALTAWGGVPGLGVYLGIIPSFLIDAPGSGPVHRAFVSRLRTDECELDGCRLSRSHTRMGELRSGPRRRCLSDPVFLDDRAVWLASRIHFGRRCNSSSRRGVVPVCAGLSGRTFQYCARVEKAFHLLASAADEPQLDAADNRHGRSRIFRIHLLLLDLLLPR